MKRLLFTLLIFSTILSVSGQITFEKTYFYKELGEGNVIYSDYDGYIMAGGLRDNMRNFLFILKTDLYGDTVWVRKYDFGLSQNDYIWLRANATDQAGNKYYALNNIVDSANLIKFDSNWNMVWKKRLDNNFQVQRMAVTHEGNILVVGIDQSSSAYITMLNPDGIIQWHSGDLPNDYYYYPEFPFLTELPDSKIMLIVNWKNSISFDNYPSEIYKFSNTGDSLSAEIFNSAGSYNHILYSQFKENELISLCLKQNDNISARLIRHEVDGTIITETDLHNDVAIDNFISNPDNTIITASLKGTYQTYSLCLEAYNVNGDSLWSSNIGNTDQKHIYTMKRLEDKGLLLAGWTRYTDYKNAPYLIRTDSLGKISPVSLPESSDATLMVYPNPVSGTVIFETPEILTGTLKLFNAAGIKCDEVPLTSPKTVYTTQKLKGGVYLYNIISNNQTLRGKLIIN